MCKQKTVTTLLLTRPGKPGKGADDTTRDIVEALGEKQKGGVVVSYHNSPFDTLMGCTGGETPALDCLTSLALLGAARTPPYVLTGEIIPNIT